MKKYITLIGLAVILAGCNSGEHAASYSTVIGDITIVDNGGTNTTSKQLSADVDACNGVAAKANDQANKKLENKSK